MPEIFMRFPTTKEIVDFLYEDYTTILRGKGLKR